LTDEKIIDLYWARDERAIQETEEKYGAYCFAAANGILADAEDAKEAVNDTWLRAWNTIPPQRPAVLRLFLAKIVRNQALMRCRSRGAAKRGGTVLISAIEELNECVAGSQSVEETLDAKELGCAIEGFLETVSVQSRNVFLRRYFFFEEIPDIARRYGLKEGNVMTILSRTRRKLKQYLIQEGYEL